MNKPLFVLATVFILTTLSLVESQQSQSIVNKPNSKVAKEQNSNSELSKEEMMAVKAKRLLTTHLPRGVESLEFKDGALHLKRGFKTLQNPDGSFTLARANGNGTGNSAEGSWSCVCGDGSGSCQASISKGFLLCIAQQGSTCKECVLVISVGKISTKLAIY